MPNFQQWLNAWVKANKQQSTTAPPESNSNDVPNRRAIQSHSMKAQSNGVASSQSASMVAKGRKPECAPTANGSAVANGSVKKLWEQDSLMETQRTAIEPGSLDNTVATSSEPAAEVDPELEAIRKHTNRKHKRRLQRTSSFSDLIREEAKLQVLRNSSRHVSVERLNYPGSGGSREWRRHNHTLNQASHQLQHPPKAFPPPPTLHHSFVAPAEQPLDVASSSNFSSRESVSPAETATTVQQSNVVYHRSYSDGGHYSEIDHSNSALLGVAEFFGTELEDQQIRMNSTANSAQNHNHAPQHGSEDEQPSYFQSYQHDNRPFETRTTLSSSYRQLTAHNSNNNHTSNSRLHHSHYKNGTRHTVHHSFIPPRPFNHNNPPLPAYRRSQTAPFSSVPATRAKSPQTDQHTEDKDAGLLLAGVRLPFFSNHQAGDSAANHHTGGNDTDSDLNPFGVGESNCKGCLIAQAELQCAQESLEYMRSMAIRKEYTCSKCNSSNGDSAARKIPSLAVKSASQQMSEVTARHKKQVEQLLKERNTWQRKMHMKLDKVSNLAQLLNNESSFRVEESKSLRDELNEVKMDRDRMAAELEQLKRTVEVHEKEQEEHRQVQEKMAKYESDGLHQAQQAIAVRDDMIAKLTEKLGATLDTLTLEREQQRQRRQIIFPPALSQGRATLQANGNAGKRNETHKAHAIGSSQPWCQSDGRANDELKLLRAQLFESQRLLELTQREAKDKEADLLVRCKKLEEQLEQTKIKEAENMSMPRERHPLSEQNEQDDEKDFS